MLTIEGPLSDQRCASSVRSVKCARGAGVCSGLAAKGDMFGLYCGIVQSCFESVRGGLYGD